MFSAETTSHEFCLNITRVLGMPLANESHIHRPSGNASSKALAMCE